MPQRKQDARQAIKEINDQLQKIPSQSLILESFEKSGPKGNVRWTCIYRLNGTVVGRGSAATKKEEAKRLAAINALPNLKHFRNLRYFRETRKV
ncbi:hypothetical protein FRC17_010619 [Serendipita sp. 399]|nr:hypothetical protein FRC17_010619 [Serendipita sp. 399]